MIVKCLNCGKKFEKRNAAIKLSPNHYCSRSCSSSANNRKNPRKKRTKKCLSCDNYILSNRKRCKNCWPNIISPDTTLGEAMNLIGVRSSVYNTIRSRARSIAKKLGMNKCSCGYDKHVEIAHLKSIASFSLDTKLSVINDPSNLAAMCPNCHWEYDNKK
jgi:hypothetical protein